MKSQVIFQQLELANTLPTLKAKGSLDYIQTLYVQWNRKTVGRWQNG